MATARLNLSNFGISAESPIDFSAYKTLSDKYALATHETMNAHATHVNADPARVSAAVPIETAAVTTRGLDELTVVEP